MPEVLQKYSTVTGDRLKRPADGDWLMVRRTYDGWGFSPLRQITPENVSHLEPLWSFSTGAINGHEATPIVNNGVMFISTPGNQVIAIDARTGSLLWRYRNTPGPEVVNLHPTSRGVALYQDKVFLAEAEATLVALDARTGKPCGPRVEQPQELLHVDGATDCRRQGRRRCIGRRTGRADSSRKTSTPGNGWRTFCARAR
jgi:alcohol dehydrogenase (cytochrome c)